MTGRAKRGVYLRNVVQVTEAHNVPGAWWYAKLECGHTALRPAKAISRVRCFECERADRG